MKTFTKHLRWLLVSLMLVAGMSAWAQTDPYYTLDTNGSTNTTNSNYANTGTATVNGIEWTFTGNGTMNPWRLGGKSLSNVDRTVYTNTAMGSAINEVVLTVGTASSITVNSLKLTVASDASFKTVLDEVSATFNASSDITFQPSTGTEWATGAYYKFTFNVTVSGSSNKFVQFSGVKFYAPTAANAVATPTFTPSAGTYTSAQSVELNTTTDGATIYYTTDGTDPTTSSSVYSSAINVSTTTTIKALAVKSGMDNSSVASATYNIVSIEHAGTAEDPYTVADARAAIDAATGLTGVYATGIVSEIVTAYNSEYGNITYNITADGTTDGDFLQAYRGKSYNGDNFTSEDDIQVGDEVVIYGTLKKYNTTYEFEADNQLVSNSRTTSDSRTPTTMYFAQDYATLVAPGTEFTITVGETVPEIVGYVKIGDYEAYLPFTTALTYSGNNDALGTVDATTGAVTLVDGATGTLKVTATFEGDSERKGCEGYYTLKVKPAEVTPTGTGDEITAAFIDISGNSYSDWSGKTGTSGAVYAGNTYGGSTAVQMRSSNSNSGIVTTSSPGKVTLVTVEWNSNTSSSRTLDIYGSNTAYTSAADLYDSTKQGTKLGSICIDDATQLVITGDYAYIGIRSNNGALYCDKITIYWETTPDTRMETTVTLNPATETYNVNLGEAFTAPTANVNDGTNVLLATLTYESSEPTVATVDASGAVTLLAAGETTITVKYAGDEDYKPSQASYTINVTAPATVYTTIQQLQEAATSTSTDFEMQMTDIYVTGVKNSQAWISDGTYGALIYTNGHGLMAGQKLNGSLTAKLVLFNGATEITNFSSTGLTITEETLAAQTKTIGDITIANQSLPVMFNNVTYDATAKTFSDGTNTIAFYDQFAVSPTLEDGHVYNIAGLVIYYNKLQIAPLKAEGVVDVTPAAAVEAPVFSVAEGNYTEDQTVTITCATTGTDIFYTLDGSDPTDESTPYSAPIVISETTTLKAIAYDGDNNTSAITTATYTINKPDVPNAKAYGTEYYTKVTDLSQIEDGDAVIIVNEAYNVALSTTQQTNNRKEVEFEWIPWIGGSFVQLADNSTVEKFIIDKDGDNFYFYASRGTDDGYIYAASKTANQLKTTDTKSDNAKAAITIENGDATIKFQGDNTRNWLRYNSTAGVFACYTSGQQSVQLYVERPTYEMEAEQQVTVVDEQECYKTFIAPYDAEFDGEYAEAFIVTLSTDQKEANLTEVHCVPAGTPIIYKYKTAGTHPIQRAVSSTVMDDVSANVLKVSRGEVTGDGTVFVLNKMSQGIGFYPLNEGKTLACGKCYLTIEKSSGVKFIGFNVDDLATGIETVESTRYKVQGTIYDLQGRRVTTPAHGLYIVGGKKVFIK